MGPQYYICRRASSFLLVLPNKVSTVLRCSSHGSHRPPHHSCVATFPGVEILHRLRAGFAGPALVIRPPLILAHHFLDFSFLAGFSLSLTSPCASHVLHFDKRPYSSDTCLLGACNPMMWPIHVSRHTDSECGNFDIGSVFGPLLAPSAPHHAPVSAAVLPLLRGHAYRMLIGACTLILRRPKSGLQAFRGRAAGCRIKIGARSCTTLGC